VDVVLVRWPSEGPLRDRLRVDGVPRLLVLEDAEPPPPLDGCLEDWVRESASLTDVDARIQGLRERFHQHAEPVAGAGPTLDDHGVLRHEGRWVSLPPVEARLAAAMLDRFGLVVSRDAMARAGWPDGSPGRNALDVHVLRLRRRLGTVGLVIQTVRARGYLLESEVRRATVAQA
jgi:DNA-binding winged helix-turn-helix (wHTH) protein